MSTSRPIEISNLGPLGQLRTGRLPRRVAQLFIGLVLFGFSIALMLGYGREFPDHDVAEERAVRMFAPRVFSACSTS